MTSSRGMMGGRRLPGGLEVLDRLPDGYLAEVNEMHRELSKITSQIAEYIDTYAKDKGIEFLGLEGFYRCVEVGVNNGLVNYLGCSCFGYGIIPLGVHSAVHPEICFGCIDNSWELSIVTKNNNAETARYNIAIEVNCDRKKPVIYQIPMVVCKVPNSKATCKMAPNINIVICERQPDGSLAHKAYLMDYKWS